MPQGRRLQRECPGVPGKRLHYSQVARQHLELIRAASMIMNAAVAAGFDLEPMPAVNVVVLFADRQTPNLFLPLIFCTIRRSRRVLWGSFHGQTPGL